MKRISLDELQTDMEQRHIDAVAKAERAVVRAAVAFCRSATTLEPLAKLENAVDQLRAARKAKR